MSYDKTSLKLSYPHLIVVLMCALSVLACTSKPPSRYAIKQDTAPNFDYGTIEYQSVHPKHEPYNVWTSRPYKVMGQYYTPMLTGKGHEEKGNASWYGQKFHGHKTANGEIFDMFGLTAAHKTLPLPSFVKVTNLNNQRSVIVRVNDRGPFHDDRVLDLSYGAAKKLGFHQQGVAHIKLQVIHVSENGDTTIGAQATQSSQLTAAMPAQPNDNMEELLPGDLEEDFIETIAAPSPELFVQVMAMTDEAKAKSLALGLKNLLQVSASTIQEERIYKLHLGPLQNEDKAKHLIKELSKIGFDEAFTVEVLP